MVMRYRVGDKVALKDKENMLGGELIEIGCVNYKTSTYRSEQAVSIFFTNDDIDHKNVKYRTGEIGMRAKFIGRDGSMGFEHGKVYNIETYVGSKLFRRGGYLWLRDKDSGLKCPYTNMETLLNNWVQLER